MKYSLWVPVAAIVISWIMGLAGAGYRVGNLETRISNLEMAITELRSVPIKLTVVEVKIDESNKRQEMIEKHLERLVEMNKEMREDR